MSAGDTETEPQIRSCIQSMLSVQPQLGNIHCVMFISFGVFLKFSLDSRPGKHDRIALLSIALSKERWITDAQFEHNLIRSCIAIFCLEFATQVQCSGTKLDTQNGIATTSTQPFTASLHISCYLDIV